MNRRLLMHYLGVCLICLSLSQVSTTGAQTNDEWLALNPSGVLAVRAIYADNDLVLATYSNNDVYRSTDNGDHWEKAEAIPSTVLSFIFSEGKYFAATDKGIYRSADRGLSWREANAGLVMTGSSGATVPIIYDLVASNGALYTLASTAGSNTSSLFVSTDGGDSWAERQTGLMAAQGIKSILIIVGNAILFFDAQGHIYRLDNGGQILIEVAPSNYADTVGVAKVIFAEGQTLFARGAKTGENPFGLYRSTDGGKTWHASGTGIFFNPICVSAGVNALGGNQKVLFASRVTECSSPNVTDIYSSFDQGVSWTHISTPSGWPLDRYSVAKMIAVNDKYVFLTAGSLRFDNQDKLFRRSYTPTATLYFATVSAASYSQYAVAREAIVAGFGMNLSDRTEVATTLPLATSLASVKVLVEDSTGTQREAPLFFVSPTQINYQIPAEAALGEAIITVKKEGIVVSVGRAMINAFSPSFFTANANGQGAPAAVVLRFKADGAQVYEPVARFDATLNQFVPVPIDLGTGTDRVYLILFGTGIRGRQNIEGANIYTTVLPDPILADYAGPAPGFVGLDQVNVLLPASLAGKGEIDLMMNSFTPSNKVRINIK